MTPAAGPWRLQRLLSAPHRLGFVIGAVWMSALALWWLSVLVLDQLGVLLSWAVPQARAHGLLFTLGFMPAFMSGFLFTAGPRWLGLPGIDARRLLSALLQFGVGGLIVLVGVHAGAWLASLGVATAACGWLRLTLRFAVMVRASQAADRLHAQGVLVASFVGVGAMLLASAALLQGDDTLLRSAVQLSLWAFVAPVYALVSHRMIPFLSAADLSQLEAWRPNVLLLPMLGGLALSGVAEMGGLPPWLIAPPLALASVALLALVVRWRQVQRLQGESFRLLRMVRGGLVWLGLALGLQAASQILQAAGHAGLGTAPLHALALGWLGGTLIAMATRVTAGYSGRAQAIDRLGWATYRLLQLGVLLRVAAALGLAVALLPAAAIWACVVVTWSWRHGGWLGRPRVDGRPG